MIYFLLLLCMITKQVGTSSISDIHNLYSHLINDYNKEIRPPNNQSLLGVDCAFDLVAIKEFDEVSGKFVISGVLSGTWSDDRLTWDPKDYNMTYNISISQNKIWKPTFILATAFNTQKEVGHDYLSVRAYHTGTVMWFYPDIFESFCSADVTYFPFDEQICSLQFISFGTLPFEVKLNAEVYDPTVFYTENPAWVLEEINTKCSVGFYYIYEVKIRIRRRPMFFLVNIISPVMFLTLLNSFVFLVPFESGERMSYALTVLLALAVSMTMVTTHLPTTSQTMSLLCYCLAGNLILSSLICFLNMLQLRLFHKDNKKDPVPEYLKEIILFCNIRKQEVDKQASVSSDGGNDRDAQKEMRACISTITWQETAKMIDKCYLVLVLLVQGAIIIGFILAMINKNS